MNTELTMYLDSDFEDCVRIYVDAFTAPPLSYDFVTKEKAWRYIKDLINTPGFLGYTYRVDGEIAAFIFGTLDNYFEGTMYHVKEFAVLSEKQRGGIGSQVMAQLEIKLAGYGVEAISLHTSRSLPAFGFYQKNGYEELTENVSFMKQLIN